MIQSAAQSPKQDLAIQELSVEVNQPLSCFQIREKLDAFVYGNARLEETHSAIKRVLFAHLENCPACCRSFDVRIQGHSGGRSNIL